MTFFRLCSIPAHSTSRSAPYFASCWELARPDGYFRGQERSTSRGDEQIEQIKVPLTLSYNYDAIRAPGLPLFPPTGPTSRRGIGCPAGIAGGKPADSRIARLQWIPLELNRCSPPPCARFGSRFWCESFFAARPCQTGKCFGLLVKTMAARDFSHHCLAHALLSVKLSRYGCRAQTTARYRHVGIVTHDSRNTVTRVE